MCHGRRFLLFLLISVVFSFHFFIPPSHSQGTNDAILLNGTSAYVDVPYNANLNITGALTLEAWVKTSSTSYQHVLERGDWFQNQMNYDLTLSEGKVRMDIMQSNGSYAAVVANTVMSLNAWHHIAGVYDGSQMRVYLDGVLDGTATATMAPGSNSTGLRIGKSSFLYFPNYFNGRIDEVRVSNAAIYTSNFTPNAHLTATSTTKGLWRFDGQTANDTSGSGAHGSLQGGAQYSTDVPTGPNSSPTVSITDPLNNTNFTAGSNIVIDAFASDSDGTVTQVEFFQGSTLLGSDATPPYTFVWNNVAADSYSINARATDNLGATITSTPITVTVTQTGGYRSVLFNGTSSYVDVPYNANLNITSALTVEAWVKTSSTSYQHVLERGDWFQNQMSYDLTVSEGKVRMDIMQSNGSYAAVVGTTVMSLSAWHHIAGVYDGSQMRVYLDGALNGTATATMAPGNNSTGLRIGKSSFLYFPNYFSGRIDEVRVSNAAIYSSNFTPNAHLTTTSSTKGLWKFDNETTNDSSASCANGSLQGGATYSTDVPVGSGGGTQVPVAVANGPYSAQLGQPVSFSSNGSFDPDGTISSYHWNFGDGTSANSPNPSHTYQTAGLFTATLTVTDNSGLRSSATAVVSINGTSEARLDPLNETGGGGENPLSRNFNWNMPLLGLPGRAGMNLGLTLSYNSLVWTKNGSYISFDDDRGFPSPGFRLGFPVIQPIYYNAEVGKYAFLFIGPDGSRTELRQLGTSAFYEAADSSHLLLDASAMTLFTTDGAQFSYVLMGSEYNCTKIKDRNGNYLTINYTSFGRIDTIIDTLARSIKFNYDNGRLTSITQVWNQGSASQITHNWATFTYSDTTIVTNFTGLNVYGPTNNSTIKTLSTVTLADGSHSDFSYTSWGQVWKISGYAADNHLLSQRAYNLPGSPLIATSPQADCPRFTQRRDWAQYWNGDTDATPASTEEAVTTFSDPVPGTWTMPDGTTETGIAVQVTAPDGTANKIYFFGTVGTSSGWRRGLPALVETYTGTNWRRKVMTTWTQDSTSVSYPLNPRVTETNIYDPENNRARTRITYQQFTFASGLSCYLPRDTYEYAADAATILRSTQTDYDLSTSYTSITPIKGRILGLVSEKRLYDGKVNSGGILMSKVKFNYDENLSGESIGVPVVQHDGENFSASFISGRGNLSSVKRHNVDNEALFTISSTKYNTTGAVISTKDASDHETTIGYADSFSDGNNGRNTFAYPTVVSDPDGYSSTAKYNFDFGAVTRRQTPQTNSTQNVPGPEQSWRFDTLGRLQQVTNLVNNAYTRFEYPTSQIRVDSYSTIQEGQGEAHSFTITDGVGRVVATAKDHPGSVGGFSGQKFVYDAMGRVIKTSNPTETSASGAPSQWNAAGDDASAGWIYVEQTVDWKGRPLVMTNPSVTSNPSETTTKQISYSGCGCAGGEVVTITDEGAIDATGAVKKRQQKIYSDVLGRTVKTEIFNWDGAGPNGTGGTVYAATTFTYNARDQLTLERRFAGPTSSSTYQDTTMSYDGYGRLNTQHLPQQQVDTNISASTNHTTWNYNNDDTVQSVTDARGVITTFGYNARHLVTAVAFNSSVIPTGSNVIPTTSIAYSYDAAGNRITMSDGSGAVNYHYDQLSRMDWEERSFAGLQYGGVFRLSYEYNLGGILTKVTDQRSATSFTETLDKLGRVTTVNAVGAAGTQSQFVSNTQYRAWGGLKSRTQPGFTVNLTYNSRLLPKSYSMDGLLPVQMAYEYHNDGSIRYANDQSGQFLDVVDRAYSYDAAGRLQHAYSGVEARNFVNNTSGGAPDGPYDHAYLYDSWGNLVRDSGRIWSRTIYTSDTYDVNNRVPTWSYDADGNVLSRNEVATTISPFVPARYTYDAAGRHVGSTQTRTYTLEYGNETSVFVNSQSFDGDNQMTHYALVRNATPSNPQTPPSSQTTAEAYLLRSTVLGGSVISEYKGDGTWSKTHVYAGDERLGQQTTAPIGTPQSILENLDPITGDGIKHSSNGGYFGMTTLDAGGIDVGVSDPFPPDGGGAENGDLGELTKSVPFITPIGGGGATCMLDGLAIECVRIRGNSSVQCANNDCNATVTLVGRSNGRVVGTWVQPAPEGWDPSYDGTYVFNDGLPWRRKGGDPPRRRTGGQISNHASQNSTRRMSALEVSSLMDDILNLFESHPGCESKINAILRELSNASGFDGGSIRDIVERFRTDGIVYTADIPNESSSAGTGIAGSPAISFSPGDNVETSARTMIGEMIHWAGMIGPFFEGFPYSSYYGGPFRFTDYYPDAALAAAGNKVGLTMSVEQYRRTYPDHVARDKAKFGSDWADSKVAHFGGIDNACGTPNFFRPQFAKP